MAKREDSRATKGIKIYRLGHIIGLVEKTLRTGEKMQPYRVETLAYRASAGIAHLQKCLKDYDRLLSFKLKDHIVRIIGEHEQEDTVGTEWSSEERGAFWFGYDTGMAIGGREMEAEG